MKTKNLDDLFPRVTLKQIIPLLADKGWSIRRITRDDVYGGYTSGYLATDHLGITERWSSLQDLKMNCIDESRCITGFLTK